MNTKTEIIDMITDYLSGEKVFVYSELSDKLDKLVDEGVEAGRHIEHDAEYWEGCEEEFKQLHSIKAK